MIVLFFTPDQYTDTTYKWYKIKAWSYALSVWELPKKASFKKVDIIRTNRTTGS